MSPIFKILLLYLTWRVGLLLLALFAIYFIPLGSTDRFLGGGPLNYKIAPELFSWANFDGEHYLSIAIFGYKGLEQTFFPIYPMLISFFAKPFSPDLISALINSTIAGLFISNLSFCFALIVLWKLLIIDFSKKIALFTIILLVIFPTSFYFGAVYNESLFLLLALLAFYNARTKSWFLASLFGILASATRIFGILLLPAFLIEAYLQKEKSINFFWILLIPLGLGGYMLYQYVTIGDPLAFYNLQHLVGEQRQSGLVLLPQVYFRYIKMLFSVSPTNFIYQTILLEFIVGIVFFILPIYGFFKKIRISYLFYALIGFLITTLQGGMSSVPRYVLVFFPSFIALALWVLSLHKIVRVTIVLILILLLFIETSLFLRGYWIA
ncbi:hypothetical protein HYZ05_03065 [Candidatus Daviesbacteria bacterium]|nr:hypothetical protein [Candidatus Daviesbacteria bacterium]